MTLPAGPSDGPHLGLEQLADLDEGLLERAAADAARAHLAGCPTCTADQAALTALRADLADLPAGDQPLPADVAARWDAALAGAAGPGSDAPPRTVGATVVPEVDELETRRAARRRRGTQLLQVAAGLVVLLGLTGIGYTLVAGGGDSNGTSSASGDSAAGRAAEDAAGGGRGAPTVVRSGTDYRAASIASAVGAVTGATPAAGSPGLKAESESAAPSSPANGLSASPGPGASDTGVQPLADPQALTACLARLDLVGPPIGVDLARFEGRPAAVIVLPTEGDPTHADVYAVAPSCPAGDFLYFARVAR